MAGLLPRASVSFLVAMLALPWASSVRPDEAPGIHSGSTSPDVLRLRPYRARYAIYRNGRLTGKATVSLVQYGERWVLNSEGRGTHGLAKILAARDDEEVSGHLQQGRFLPDRYTRHTRVAGIDDLWQVDFNWAERRVSIQHDKDDPLSLDMVGDSLDPLSLKMAMRQRLSQPGAPLSFQMVEEDEIEEQNFRLLPNERMETSLGCLRAIPVEKIRENSIRYTRAWHAPDLGFIELRVEHGKIGGNQLEMRITELTLDGVDIRPRPGCAALQNTVEAEPSDGGPDGQ